MLDRQTCLRLERRLVRLDPPPRPGEPPPRPDLGTLAILRRGLGKSYGEAFERDGWVLRALETSADEHTTSARLVDGDIEWACHVASFFSLHRRAGSESFAAAFRQHWRLRDEAVSAARRFAVLLDADPEELPTHVRRAVQVLKADDLTFCWADLLFDLTRWNDSGRKVHRRWSRDFWTEPRTTRTVPTEQPTPE